MSVSGAAQAQIDALEKTVKALSKRVDALESDKAGTKTEPAKAPAKS